MHQRILRRHIRKGTLGLVLPDGRRERYGEGEPAAEWVIHDPKALRRIAADPDLAFGETYMEGAWSAGEGGLVRLLEVLLTNFPLRHERGWRAALKRLWQQGNRIARSRRNAAHHYDLDEWLFRRFLDREMHYSCAYFARPDMTLEEAQEAKARHIAAKLLLRPGMRVLDIGSGWGSLARHLARHHGVHVTGVTLSKEQLRVARAWAEAEGLADRLTFRLEDYREHRGRYDRIVSVGMFEHVGQPQYRTYFERARELLAPDGVMLLHTIGRLGPPTTTNAWIRRYIFPGGYNPALSEVAAAIEEAGLELCDVEVLRLHYAMTLAHWQARFQRHRDEVAERMGERFARMWEMYLAIAEASFRWSDMVVFQIQLARDRTAVPLTRDYLYRGEGAQAPAARGAA
ncbi:SAM-dependent methyltransferase [Inmirania thermothiophila]|uniref:Cyclopropane-fatty-acyl-phospholipid synthase n=1 Tax=Inmirania thermothiophila TaxID=1750597 RepID=A0A3N1Y8B0_9GAMM|nr:cyclopropane-fatty-acyl-phospholipid synthase family protein [Inmirania thermothiophila]ROR34771.1 cyclopropane-fatty-acyl-phospholipid synthase [Inmirania thermothiophila]